LKKLMLIVNPAAGKGGYRLNFGEAMQLLREKLNQKNVYYMNPAFDI